MKLLLDTCTFIWVVSNPTKLSATALAHFEDRENVCYLSCVSTWEMAVLTGLGRMHFKEPIKRYVPRMRRSLRVRPLRLLERATLLADKLPMHHRDPFDRMLICQAIAHGLTLLTPDDNIAKYAVSVIW
jgi:PIN domain nuclease of toxin-antitoxin system